MKWSEGCQHGANDHNSCIPIKFLILCFWYRFQMDIKSLQENKMLLRWAKPNLPYYEESYQDLHPKNAATKMLNFTLSHFTLIKWSHLIVFGKISPLMYAKVFQCLVGAPSSITPMPIRSHFRSWSEMIISTPTLRLTLLNMIEL